MYALNKEQKEKKMQFMTIRDLRGKSGEIQKRLPEEKEMVLTSNGKHIGILISTSPDRMEESLSMIRRLQAMEAVNRMQRRSVEAGTDRMSLKEINEEIAGARKERRAG